MGKLILLCLERKVSNTLETLCKVIELSKRLLKVQLEILQPDIVIFANGAVSAKFRQDYFPHKGELSVCSELGDFCDQGIAPSQLWRFKLYPHIQCFRIQHPSSISAPSRAARRFLLQQLRYSRESNSSRIAVQV